MDFKPLSSLVKLWHDKNKMLGLLCNFNNDMFLTLKLEIVQQCIISDSYIVCLPVSTLSFIIFQFSCVLPFF